MSSISLTPHLSPLTSYNLTCPLLLAPCSLPLAPSICKIRKKNENNLPFGAKSKENP